MLEIYVLSYLGGAESPQAGPFTFGCCATNLLYAAVNRARATAVSHLLLKLGHLQLKNLDAPGFGFASYQDRIYAQQHVGGDEKMARPRTTAFDYRQATTPANFVREVRDLLDF